MSARMHRFCLTITALVVLLVSSCTATPKAVPTQEGLTYTQAAETIIAELTANAPTATIPPPATPTAVLVPELVGATVTVEALPDTSTPLPSDTPFPTDTPQPLFTPTLAFTLTPTNTPEPTYVLEFKDDFASAVAGWTVDNNEDMKLRYTRSGYAITNKVKNDPVYSVRYGQYINTRVEVDAYRLSGPFDGYYGVICRFISGSNYYILAVGVDGWFGIGKQKGGALTWLTEGRDSGGAVYTGNVTNHIRADCIGNRLTLYANGVKIAEVQDNEFTAGAIGLAAGTRKVSGFEALFDNFMVYIPQ